MDRDAATSHSSFTSVHLLLAVVAAFVIIFANSIKAPAQSASKVAAVVDGHEITNAEVDDAAVAKVFELEQQMYAIRKATLENLVTHAILEAQAKRQHISVEELKKQMSAGPVQVTEAEVEKLYQENKAAFAAMDPDESRLRLQFDLETQARMQKYKAFLQVLTSKAKVEIRLNEPKLSASNLAYTVSAGPANAAVTITAFIDFQCPYCRQFHNVLKQILKAYPSDVRLIFRNLPLDIHADAALASKASLCANEQDGFWKFHDALFAADDLTIESLKKLAVGQGLDLTRFQECLKSEKTNTALRQDIDEAKHFGISATPALIVNGKLLIGALSFEDFKAVVDREIELAKKLPATKSR